MKTKRRIILVLTAVFMCFFCSTGVYAATVARVRSKSYSSLQSAVDAAKNGDTIWVTKAISAKTAVKVTGKKSITIDFCHNEYSFDQESFAFTVNATKLTVNNANIASKTGAFEVGKKSNLTIKNGNVTGYMKNAGMLLIKNGTFEGSGNANDTPAPAIRNSGTLKVYNGTFTGNKRDVIWNFSKARIYNGTFKASDSACIRNGVNADMQIDNGAFISNGDNSSYLIKNNGNFTISTGTFKGYIENRIHNTGKMSFRISGGVFRGLSGYKHVNNAAGKMVITGGTFTTTRANTVFNDINGVLTISDGRFAVKSEEDHFALYSAGTLTLTGGCFRVNGKARDSIGCVKGSKWRKSAGADGDVYVVAFPGGQGFPGFPGFPGSSEQLEFPG